MMIASDQLEAFSAVARLAHFSNAAKSLGLTQSALSLRIKKLEGSLASTLFVRNRGGVHLTEAGYTLLKYASLKDSLENEVLEKILGSTGNADNSEVRGTLRVGAFSSIARSIILPALTPLLQKNPKVSLQLITREMDELFGALRRSEVDFLFLDRALEEESLVSTLVGYEQNVLARPRDRAFPTNVYLDHDERDPVTLRYLATHKIKLGAKDRRMFLDDVYGLVDGVRFGLGRAVLPLHLIRDQRGIIRDPGFKPIKSPVYLHYYQQPYYSKLHAEVIQVLLKLDAFQLR
jgi:DNA-binding transcriptional LysR family regulator